MFDPLFCRFQDVLENTLRHALDCSFFVNCIRDVDTSTLEIHIPHTRNVRTTDLNVKACGEKFYRHSVHINVIAIVKMFLRVLACFPFFLLDCCTGICVSTGVALKCWIFFIICWTVLNVELKSMKRILMMKLKMEETYYSILMFPSYPCRQTAGGPAVD